MAPIGEGGMVRSRLRCNASRPIDIDFEVRSLLPECGVLGRIRPAATAARPFEFSQSLKPIADAAAVVSVCVMLISTRRMPLRVAMRAVSPVSVATG